MALVTENLKIRSPRPEGRCRRANPGRPPVNERPYDANRSGWCDGRLATPDRCRADSSAWQALGHFEKPFLSLAGDRDNLLGKKDVVERLVTHIPGARGQPHARFDAGHFIQDELGPTMAEQVNAFIHSTPRK